MSVTLWLANLVVEHGLAPVAAILAMAVALAVSAIAGWMCGRAL